MECSCGGGTVIHCKCTRGVLCEMNQSLASTLKLNAMICLRRNALHLIVCLLMCVEDAANEALLAKGNPIDRALSPDNADQLYCIDCISPSLASVRCVCVCAAGEVMCVLGKHTQVAVQACAMSLLRYVGW